MAIKPISKLDQYQNVGATDGGSAGTVGGNIHLYDLLNLNDTSPTLQDPYSVKSTDQLNLTFAEDDFYNLLFEVSKPIDAGAQGLNSNEYSSFKLTYEDLIQNIIVDVKQWLNARNNLGDFDLCALVYRDYFFGGNKKFGGSISVANNLSVHRNTVTEGALNVGEDVFVGGKLDVVHAISSGSSISAYNGIYARGGLYTGTLTSDNNGTTISPGTNGFVVSDILSGKTAGLTVAVPTTINNYAEIMNNLSVDSGLFVSNGAKILGGGMNVTGTAIFNGDISVAGIANLTAEHAKWSDLAEFYKADDIYEPGTLVKFGGGSEVTIATSQSKEVNAVVTTKPAFLMNCGLKDDPLGCAIALAGRVPVKVIGKVKKFDAIVLSKYDGIAVAVNRDEVKNSDIEVIGRALESSDDDLVKLVECVVKFRI